MRPKMSIPALIFDLDDTLVATAKAWTIAEESILKAFETDYDQAFLAHLSGHSARDVARIIHKHAKPPVTLEHVQGCFDRALLNAMEVAPLMPRPGAVDLVRTKSRGWKR